MNQKPEKPDESECCGSGCKPCILDVYEENLKKWELKQEIEAESKALSQSKYLPFLITSIKSITGDTKEYEFQAVELRNEIKNKILFKNAQIDVDYIILNSLLILKMGEYLILKGESLNEVISRPYTPVLCKNDFKRGVFKIIIKLYPDGKMSKFVKGLEISDIVFWRGPYKEFKYIPNSFKNILLIGGGTGVVPLYNIAKEIVETDEEETWVKMMTSFKSVDSIILRQEVNKLKDYWNFKLDAYITNQGDSNYSLSYKESFNFKKIDKTVIENEFKNNNNNSILIVISGPNVFNQCMYDYAMNYVAKENIFVFW